jgi:hypothetical protein
MHAFVLYKKKGSVLAIVTLSSIAGIFIDALFINSLFFPEIMLWMWILAGLIEKPVLTL